MAGGDVSGGGELVQCSVVEDITVQYRTVGYCVLHWSTGQCNVSEDK